MKYPGLVKSGAREPGATWLARGATDSLTVEPGGLPSYFGTDYMHTGMTGHPLNTLTI